jgi:hypothetical protein
MKVGMPGSNQGNLVPVRDVGTQNTDIPWASNVDEVWLECENLFTYLFRVAGE